MNEKVKKVLDENPWFLGTFSDEPNVIPVGFKSVAEDGKLIVGDVMMATTVENIKANGKIAVSALNPETSEGYQIKGSVEYFTEGPVLEALVKKAAEIFKGALVPKGALVITPEKIIVTTPGPDNKKEL